MSDDHYYVERRTDLGWESAGLGTPFSNEQQALAWLEQHGWEGERFRVIRVVSDLVIPSAAKKVG